MVKVIAPADPRPLLCFNCRRPDDNMHLLVTKCGFSDMHRPSCVECYLMPVDRIGIDWRASAARYARARFELVEMPSPEPGYLDPWRRGLSSYIDRLHMGIKMLNEDGDS